jgi:type I restriction enzyme S subunit
MSKLQDLIRELCPEGVEFKKLGTLCKVLRGKRLTKDKLSESNKYPVFHGGIEPLGFYNEYNRSENTVMIINVGASAGTVGFCDKKFWSSDGCFCLSENPEIDSKYLFYYLSNYEYQFTSKVRYAGIPTLDAKVITDFEIPVPPLPVQEEIVRILDRFAEYAAELQAELQARKEQYEYYRNRLLSFNPSASGSGIDDVDKNDVTGWGGHSYDICWKTMGEICSFKYGYTDKAKDKGTARYIRITDINEDGYLSPKDKKYVDLADDNKQSMAKKGDLLMARTGATFGKTLYVDSEEPAIYASFLIKITFNTDEIMNRFYWHYSKSKFYWLQANKLVSTGGQPQFNANALAQLVIPIPPLAEQQRIVSILDRFESLVNDLTAGLPAEIEARRQQYEYYRNQLLTFKRLA